MWVRNTAISAIMELVNAASAYLNACEKGAEELDPALSWLVATDIVARGIDIDDIRLVINYDVPHDSEDYVHRIGRTARANNDGCAITFVSETEQNKFKQIENFLEKEIYKIPVPEELGEAPAYNPRSAKPKGNSQSASGKKRSSNGNRRRKKKSAPASPSPAKA